ncbi:hypothetical protein F8388_001186 [Cannabis sativa]|uniref:peroxidase n=1 Tax=Cannabis sativa TaxID=3483 RepID=A0A7J6ES80_CANSA|nr:hypothetical protein F8388_001186 [Cannabis sativa]KAF4377049.1 hypothetical protein G4B88_023835 [Cannabis sativa]
MHVLLTLILLVVVSSRTTTCIGGELSSSKFYDESCPKALSTIRSSITRAVSRERRMAASLIRLHFHDCFVHSDIDANFARTRQRRCPAVSSPKADAMLAALDLVTPNSFDANYFKNLIQKKGLLESDQVLFSGGSTDAIVTEYSKSPKTFRADFASAMIKMGDIQPFTGSAGQIRRICSIVN